MRFVPHWDRLALEQLAWCARHSAKPVLSTYGRPFPLGTSPEWIPPDGITPSLCCGWSWDENGLLKINCRALVRGGSQPRRSVYWSAHFSFSSAQLLQEVPYDPHLPMLFIGEEILMSVRLFTHGWDVYTPNENVVYHLWETNYRRIYYNDMPKTYESLVTASVQRVHGLLGSGPPHVLNQDAKSWPLPGGGRDNATGQYCDGDVFGLGTIRNVSDFEKVAGVRFKDQHLDELGKRGGAASEDEFVALTSLQGHMQASKLGFLEVSTTTTTPTSTTAASSSGLRRGFFGSAASAEVFM